MTKTREEIARRAQIRRAIARKLEQEQAAARRLHMSEMLDQVKVLISDKEFIALLAEQKIRSVPSCLLERAAIESNEMTDQQIADSVLIFVVAWKFLFPILGSRKITGYIDKKWPVLIADFKDTFISLVMDGPFPHERRTPVKPTYFS